MRSVNDIDIFVSSSDAYSDVWPAFFTIFKREWPEYKGTIYLNTEHLEYTHEGLDIVCTKLGKQRYFGETFLRGIEYVKGEKFLLMMIDYFIERRVDVARLQEIFDIFTNKNADTFTLMTQPYGFCLLRSNPEYSLIDCSAGWQIMFSFQSAFWRKDSLKRIILPWENPWQAEYLGSRRAALCKMNFYLLTSRDYMPIVYDEAGVLHGGGKWLMSALARVNLSGVPLDMTKTGRSVYKESLSPESDFINVFARELPLRLKSWTYMIYKNPKALCMLVEDTFRRCCKLFCYVCKIIKSKYNER